MYRQKQNWTKVLLRHSLADNSLICVSFASPLLLLPPKTYIVLRVNDEGQKKKEKKTNNDPQNITQKTKGWATQTPLKTGDELRCFRWVSSSCSTYGTHRVNVVTSKI